MARAMLPPGFRFHPTDEELILYYLKRKVMGKSCRFMAISEVEIYKFAPWDLPEMSCLRNKDLEWYFFCPRDKKYPNGSRAKRSTKIGYWKTTGNDRTIVHHSCVVGMKKSLVFHTGKPPKGDRTDWVMYEYRLSDNRLAASGVVQDAFVVCKIFKKSGLGPKVGEQYGAPFNEDDWEDDADLEATVAAFPFLPSTDQPTKGNNAVTSVADLVHVPVVTTTMAESVPQSTPAVVDNPKPTSLSVAAESAAISTSRYEELLGITGPTVGMTQCGTAVLETPEMDGIQLDEFAGIILSSPYCLGSASGQLVPQQPSTGEVNFNMAAYNELNGLYDELAYLIDGVPSDGDRLDRTGSSLVPATDGNAAQPLLSELGAGNYVELNDIINGPEDAFFSNYIDPAPSPEIDIDSFFSFGPSTSYSQSRGATSD